MPRSRRALLRTLAPALAAGLAGCGSDGATPTPTPTATDTPTPTPTPTDSPTPSPTPAALRCGHDPGGGAPWPTTDGAPGRTRFAPDGPAFEEPPAVDWRAEPTVPDDVDDRYDATYQTVLVATDAVVAVRRTQFGPMVADPGGHAVQARAPEDGTLRWEHRVPQVPGPPAVFDGRVLVPVGERLIALDAADGSVAWRREFAATVTGVVPGGDRAVVRLGPTEHDQGTLLALAPDGTTAWRQAAAVDVATVAVGGGRVVVGGYQGQVRWRRPGDGRRVAGDRFPAHGDDYLAVGTLLATDCALVAATARTAAAYDLGGTRGWRRAVGTPAATDGRLLYTPRRGGERPDAVAALDVANGDRGWRRELDAELGGRPVLTGSGLVQPVADGLLALAPDGGAERWRAGPAVDGLAVGPNALYGILADTLVALR